MSVRALLAVVFTVVLLATVTPVVEDARNAHDSAAATRAAETESLLANRSLATERDELRAHVETATETLAHSQTRTLARTTPLSARESSALVSTTFDEYPGVSARALATTNGLSLRHSPDGRLDGQT